MRDTTFLQDFSFALTEPIEAGRRDFVVLNRGPHEHHVAVARLRPGIGLREILASYSDPNVPESYDVVGGTAGIGPGRANVARVTLEPGRYVLVCFIVDPASGMEHVHLSMVRIFDVVSRWLPDYHALLPQVGSGSEADRRTAHGLGSADGLRSRNAKTPGSPISPMCQSRYVRARPGSTVPLAILAGSARICG